MGPSGGCLSAVSTSRAQLHSPDCSPRCRTLMLGRLECSPTAHSSELGLELHPCSFGSEAGGSLGRPLAGAWKRAGAQKCPQGSQLLLSSLPVLYQIPSNTMGLPGGQQPVVLRGCLSHLAHTAGNSGPLGVWEVQVARPGIPNLGSHGMIQVTTGLWRSESAGDINMKCFILSNTCFQIVRT